MRPSLPPRSVLIVVASLLLASAVLGSSATGGGQLELLLRLLTVATQVLAPLPTSVAT